MMYERWLAMFYRADETRPYDVHEYPSIEALEYQLAIALRHNNPVRIVLENIQGCVEGKGFEDQ